MSEQDPIQAQIEAARQGAAQLANAPAAAQQPQQQAGGAVVNYVPAATNVPAMQPMSMDMDDMVNNHFAPTKWLKVSKEGDGLKIDNSPLYDELEVIIDLTECVPAQCVKYGSSPAKYIKTYDGVTTVHGDNFAVKVQEAYRIDPACKGVYKSVDIPMRLVADAVSPKKGDDTVFATTEDILGHSLSTTNFSEWAQFYKRLSALGLTRATVKAKLGVKKRTGNGNTWGLLTFELIEQVDAQAA